MKTSRLLECIILLVLASGAFTSLTSCKNDEDLISLGDVDSKMMLDDSWLKPIDLANPDARAVNDFFLKLDRQGDGIVIDVIFKYYGFNAYTDFQQLAYIPKCLIINTTEDMKKAFAAVDPKIPDVDFSKYTFVIGYVLLSSSELIYTTQKIAVKATEDGVLIKVPVLKPDYINFCDFMPHYFCNIYPKFIGSKAFVQTIKLN